MATTSLLLILLSSVLHLGWNLLTQASAEPRAFSRGKGAMFVGVAACVLPFLPVGSVPDGAWSCIVASGGLHALYIFALSTSYETGDVSFVYPVARSAPAFVPVVAWAAFGETVSLRGGAGIALVAAGLVLLQLGGGQEAGLRGALRTLRHGFSRREGVWALITLASVVAFSVVDKAGMTALRDDGRVAAPLRAPLYFLLEGGLSYLLLWVPAAVRPRGALRGLRRREVPRMVLATGAMLGSYGLALHVLQHEPVSYVVALRQASILLAVLFGWLVHREPHGPWRLAAAGGLVAGLALVATARAGG